MTSAALPDSVKAIGEEAFNYCDNVKLQVGNGSYAQQYAQERQIPFEIVHE